MKRVLAIALVATVTLCLGRPAVAQTGQPAALPNGKSAEVRQALTKQLVDLGLTEGEAGSRVAQLADQEIVQLVENPKQVGMGGIKDKTLIVIAVILILPSILLLAML